MYSGCMDTRYTNYSPDAGVQPSYDLCVDADAPILNLTGPAEILNLTQYSGYVDFAVSAYDVVDGDLAVTIADRVQHEVYGNYTVRYSTVDAAGNIGIATRNVTVLEFDECGTLAARLSPVVHLPLRSVPCSVSMPTLLTFVTIPMLGKLTQEPRVGFCRECALPTRGHVLADSGGERRAHRGSRLAVRLRGGVGSTGL